MLKQELYSIKELAEELNLSASSIKRILSREDAPEPKVRSEFIKGKKTCSLYDLEEVETFYKESKGRAIEKHKSKPFNSIVNSFMPTKL